MATHNKRDQAFIDSIPPIEVRKARQEIEGAEAAREYAEKAQADLHRMAKLKAQRLAGDKKPDD